ncbi:MAG TPA: PH domain-containing protein [Thermoleophilaceae bacterium]|nr:PH domain-containing protein [Thermoleophilaceae bacterium]
MRSEGPAQPRRLHPAEIVLAALENLREILIAAVVGLVVGGGAGMPPLVGLLLGLGGVVIAAIAGYVRWSHTTYSVEGVALHFRRGVISPDETSVPLGRIQAIDATQGPVQRLFGVQELHVQTAGGGAEGEIVLRAVSEDAASELRAVAGLPDPVARDLPEWRLGMGALLITAVTAPQLGVILPLVGGFAAAGDDVLFGGGEGERLVDTLADDTGTLILVVIGVAAAALLLSFLGAIVAFAGFTLVRDGDRLRIRRGLLARRAASVPLARVHAVDVVEGVLRRPFGLASLRMETAGYRSEAAAAQTLLPLVRVRDVPRLLAEFAPALAEEGAATRRSEGASRAATEAATDRPAPFQAATPDLPPAGRDAATALQPPPSRARRRYALPPALAGAALGAVLTVVVPAAWPAVPLLGLLGAADGLLRHRSAGWRDDGRRLIVRRRVIARRTLVARVDRLQEHGLRASPLQRRSGLADFEAAVGSGRTGRVRHLEAGVAGVLFERLRPATAGSDSRAATPPASPPLRG